MTHKILVTGATGNVGRATIDCLVEMGADVRAAVRPIELEGNHNLPTGIETIPFDLEDPSTFAPALQGVERLFLMRPPAITDLQVVVGGLEDEGALRQALHGADAVLSGLGPVGNKPDYVLGRSAPHIIQAMQAEGVSRLILSTGAGVRQPGDTPKLFDRVMGFLLNTFAKHVLEDSRRMVTAVVNSNLPWTIVRVPVLNDNPATGNVRVGMVGQGTGAKLSRADMAAFMLAQLQSSEYLRQAPTISN